jgi:hypothetical protein
MEATSTGPIHFVNLEYFFRLIYEARNGTLAFGSVAEWAGDIWEIAGVVAFVFTIGAIVILIYSTVRMRQLKQIEHHLYGTITDAELETQVDHARFAHVMSLIESPNESDWRQAIIEADIMLDDLLKQLGYEGAGVGDRLKKVDPARFKTLDNAWTAHKVRNDIAHQGSTFKLTNHLAYRTIKQYESVFKEFGEI